MLVDVEPLFLYARRHTLGKEGMAFVVFYANGKQMKSERFGLANIDSGEFSFSRVLSVPKGADRVFICNRIDSIGKLRRVQETDGTYRHYPV